MTQNAGRLPILDHADWPRHEGNAFNADWAKAQRDADEADKRAQAARAKRGCTCDDHQLAHIGCDCA